MAAPGDEGSPWAIGSKEGGHKSIHPQLGTLRDFDALVAATHDYGMELALDIAFQCSPDHPWVAEHKEWCSILRGQNEMKLSTGRKLEPST